jgi:sugar phosphate isomerase/epimerase
LPAIYPVSILVAPSAANYVYNTVVLEALALAFIQAKQFPWAQKFPNLLPVFYRIRDLDKDLEAQDTRRFFEPPAIQAPGVATHAERLGTGLHLRALGATELFQKADESITYAKAFGMTQMAIAALGPFNAKGTETVDDVKRYVEPFNAFADKAHAAGIVALLHNEGFVSEYIDGKPVYDMMIAELNPAATKLQFQVSSWQKGYDPVTYFHKYPGRFLSMHCQDWVKDPSTKSGFREVPLGKGVVDWKAVFTAAKTGGVKNYFVELEEDPALMPPSVPYLKSLNV